MAIFGAKICHKIPEVDFTQNPRSRKILEFPQYVYLGSEIKRKIFLDPNW